MYQLLTNIGKHSNKQRTDGHRGENCNDNQYGAPLYSSDRIIRDGSCVQECELGLLCMYIIKQFTPYHYQLFFVTIFKTTTCS